MEKTIQTQEFTLSRSRYRSLLTTKTPPRVRIFLVILGVLSLMVGLILWNLELMLALLLFPALLILVSWGAPYVLALMDPYRQQYSPGSVMFEAEHVTYIRHDGEQMQLPWKHFYRISIRAEAFVFWLNQGVFFIVPFDVFQHAEEIDVIKDKITHNARAAR